MALYAACFVKARLINCAFLLTEGVLKSMQGLYYHVAGIAPVLETNSFSARKFLGYWFMLGDKFQSQIKGTAGLGGGYGYCNYLRHQRMSMLCPPK